MVLPSYDFESCFLLCDEQAIHHAKGEDTHPLPQAGLATISESKEVDVIKQTCMSFKDSGKQEAAFAPSCHILFSFYAYPNVTNAGSNFGFLVYFPLMLLRYARVMSISVDISKAVTLKIVFF